MQKKGEVLEEIKSLIIENYGDVSKSILTSFSNDIYREIFEKKSDFDDLFSIIYSYENELAKEQEEEENESFSWYVFAGVLDLVEDGEETAKRLYSSFMKFNDISLLSKLLNQNAEWLTESQIEEVKKTAKCFDEEILKSCIANWDL